MNVFNPNRRAFIIIGNSCIIMPENDARTCQQWCAEDLNIRGATFENLVRGYMLEGKIQFFQGSYYAPALSVDVATAGIVQDAYESIYDIADVDVYNGVKPGVVGDEWLPVFKLSADRFNWELA